MNVAKLERCACCDGAGEVLVTQDVADSGKIHKINKIIGSGYRPIVITISGIALCGHCSGGGYVPADKRFKGSTLIVPLGDDPSETDE